jgi:hypothetical protein
MKFLKILVGIIPIFLLLFLVIVCDSIIYVSIKADEYGSVMEQLVEKIAGWIDGLD